MLIKLRKLLIFSYLLLNVLNVLGQSANCLSGDCQNGVGVQKSDFGVYEGQFQNGLAHGKGKFTFTSGRYDKVVYTGGFARGLFNGKGRFDYTNTRSAEKYDEGTFVEGTLNGQGIRVSKSGVVCSGNFEYGNITGIVTCINPGRGEKIPRFGYLYALSNTRGLTMDVLKYHQDTLFSDFKKCQCLEKKKFNLPSWQWTEEKYNEYNGFGDKVGEGSSPNLNFSNPEFNGLMNNTDHNIYIRGYLENYYRDRNVTEYEDASYQLSPGSIAMSNYRLPPQPGETYAGYFAGKFVFLGQYCDKDMPDCKPKVSNPNSFGLTILSGVESSDRTIKKGNKITISAKGSIVLGMFAGSSTPDGIPGFQSYSQIQGFKHGSLLVRIGEKGKWRFAGSALTFVAEADGKLQFFVNDADDSNNTGRYEITVNVK